MTVIISDEAVNIALNTWLGGIPAWRNDATERLRTEMRAALTAALPFLPVQGAVKKLAWGPVSENGNDIQSFSTLGKYVISIDDAPAGGTHYLWIAGQSDSSDYHSSYQNMFEAKAAAQADYEARILSALEPSAGDMGNPITLDIGKPITAPSAARELALEEGYRRGVEAAAKLIECGCKSLLHGKGECQFPGNCSLEDAAAIRALSSPDHADAGKVEGDGNRETLWKSAARDFGAYLASNGTPYAIDYWNECFGPLFSAPSEGAE
ncbi:hypothetical protein NJB93_19635 [Brucella intermedia]|uniref:hypothetical protein n=1 Tax=Brucella intermedia TaxID=94625 RepID=UPI00209B3C5D|nr:hypothetical protein [Brucella intermedia]MCO7728795.1 hypothetical protein [Brucella intermedia]